MNFLERMNSIDHTDGTLSPGRAGKRDRKRYGGDTDGVRHGDGDGMRSGKNHSRTAEEDE